MARATKSAIRKPATRKPVSKKAATRRSAPPATAIRGAQTDAETIESLEKLQDNLQAARRKLMRVQPDKLDDEQHARWSDQIFQLNLAISTMRNAVLGAISAAFAAELPAIEQATGQLADDLSGLQASVDVINAIGSVLGIIEKIALLAA
jgi:hypothetical protein